MQVYYPPQRRAEALILAQAMGSEAQCVNSVAEVAGADPFFFWFSKQALQLHRKNDRHGVFLSLQEVSRRAQQRSKSLLAKSLGMQKRHQHTVLDATGGFGLDSMLMSLWGAEVEVLERSPIAFALLQDGLQRFSAHHPASSTPRARAVDFAEYSAAPGSFDVVYLDPMFPTRSKTAQPNKRAQYLAACLGSSPDQGELDNLLQRARQIARHRVVLKRRRHTPLTRQPDWQILGKSVRFDVFNCS